MTSTESIRAVTRQFAAECLGDANVLDVQVEAGWDESCVPALQILLVIPAFDPGMVTKRTEIVLKVIEYLKSSGAWRTKRATTLMGGDVPAHQRSTINHQPSTINLRVSGVLDHPPRQRQTWIPKGNSGSFRHPDPHRQIK